MSRAKQLAEAKEWLNGLILQRFPADAKVVAERKWAAGLKPAKPQQPCDIGLFSDDANQLDLCEMFMEPTNDDG